MKKLYMKVGFFFVSYDVHNKQILTRQFEKKNTMQLTVYRYKINFKPLNSAIDFRF